ncbi:MAG TPA: hypothetical protein VN768_05715 [Acidimicrobiales bacterium]|nr:hypothetical protein [Acidimicrobiales bacterium]
MSDLTTDLVEPDVAGEAPLAGGPPAGTAPPLGRARLLVRPTVIYLASRALTVAAMAGAAPIANLSLTGAFDRWDTKWFMRAAATGWPSRIVTEHGHVTATTIAFLPVYPLAFRWFSALTGCPLLLSAAIVSGVTGLTATLAVWALVRRFAGPPAAERAVLLFAFFPGTFVFSLGYSEGIAITCVALGLLALLRRRWVVAGLLGAVATATIPVALAFAVSCLWAAVVAIRRDREWRALAAPVLAPVGFVAYQLWLWAHTGNPSAWRLTERGGWKSYVSPAYPFEVVWKFVTHPISSTATTNLLVVCMAFSVVCAVIAIRQRQPGPVLVYGLGAAVVALVAAPVGLRPRFILDAFPLVIALAVQLKGRSLRTVLWISALLLVVITVYSVDTFRVFP